MPRFPGAAWRPVTRYQSGSLRIPMRPGRLILHTAVSTAGSMHAYFNVSGRATPHFYVNAKGGGEQYIDTGFQSTANLEGNHDCITVESWDNGAPGGQVPDWTDAQVEWCARLAAWCHEHHGIPLERLPSSRPGTRGVGWHRLGIDGNFPSGLLAGRVSGGERWSESTGKICPGDRKIRGVVERIIPRAKQSGDDMQAEDFDRIATIVANKIDPLEKAFATFRENEAARDQAEENRDVAERERDAASRAREEAIIAAVEALDPRRRTGGGPRRPQRRDTRMTNAGTLPRLSYAPTFPDRASLEAFIERVQHVEWLDPHNMAGHLLATDQAHINEGTPA